jgi:hypothetical protein
MSGDDDEAFPDVPEEFVESAATLVVVSNETHGDVSVPEPPPSFDDDDDDNTNDADLKADAFPAPPSDLTTPVVSKQPSKAKSNDDDPRWRAALQIAQSAAEREKQQKLYAAVKYFGEALVKLDEILADTTAAPALQDAARARHAEIKAQRNQLKRTLKDNETSSPKSATGAPISIEDGDAELDAAMFPTAPVTTTTTTTTVSPKRPPVQNIATTKTTATLSPGAPRTSATASIPGKSPRATASPAAAPVAAPAPLVVDENTCFACRRPLPKNGDVLVIEGRSFHDDCMRCAVCRTKLDESVHESDDGTLFCAVHVPRSQTFEVGGALTMLPTMSKLQMQHAIAMRTNEEPAHVDFDQLRRSSSGNVASLTISDEEMRAAERSDATDDDDGGGGGSLIRRASLAKLGKKASAFFRK